MKTTIVYLVLFTAAISFWGCGKSNTQPITSVKIGTATYAASVDITNFAFSPATVHVLTGGTVTWTNKDPVAHTTTDLNGSFDSGHIETNQTYKFTFAKSGTYTYHCTLHSMMPNATVVVSDQ